MVYVRRLGVVPDFINLLFIYNETESASVADALIDICLLSSATNEDLTGSVNVTFSPVWKTSRKISGLVC